MNWIILLSLFFLSSCNLFLEKGDILIKIKGQTVNIVSNGIHINCFELMKKPIKTKLIQNLKKEKNSRYSGSIQTTLKIDKNINKQTFVGSHNLYLNFENNVLKICSPTPKKKHFKLIKKYKVKINYNIHIIDQNNHIEKILKVKSFNKSECYNSKPLIEKKEPYKKTTPYAIKILVILALYLLSIFGVYKCLK